MTSQKREEFQKRFDFAANGLKNLGFIGEIFVDQNAVVLVGHNSHSRMLLRKCYKDMKSEHKACTVFYCPRGCEQTFLISLIDVPASALSKEAKSVAGNFLKAA